MGDINQEIDSLKSYVKGNNATKIKRLRDSFVKKLQDYEGYLEFIDSLIIPYVSYVKKIKDEISEEKEVEVDEEMKVKVKALAYVEQLKKGLSALQSKIEYEDFVGDSSMIEEIIPMLSSSLYFNVNCPDAVKSIFKETFIRIINNNIDAPLNIEALFRVMDQKSKEIISVINEVIAKHQGEITEEIQKVAGGLKAMAQVYKKVVTNYFDLEEVVEILSDSEEILNEESRELLEKSYKKQEQKVSRAKERPKKKKKLSPEPEEEKPPAGFGKEIMQEFLQHKRFDNMSEEYVATDESYQEKLKDLKKRKKATAKRRKQDEEIAGNLSLLGKELLDKVNKPEEERIDRSALLSSIEKAQAARREKTNKRMEDATKADFVRELDEVSQGKKDSRIRGKVAYNNILGELHAIIFNNKKDDDKSLTGFPNSDIEKEFLKFLKRNDYPESEVKFIYSNLGDDDIRGLIREYNKIIEEKGDFFELQGLFGKFTESIYTKVEQKFESLGELLNNEIEIKDGEMALSGFINSDFEKDFRWFLFNRYEADTIKTIYSNITDEYCREYNDKYRIIIEGDVDIAEKLDVLFAEFIDKYHLILPLEYVARIKEEEDDFLYNENSKVISSNVKVVAHEEWVEVKKVEEEYWELEHTKAVVQPMQSIAKPSKPFFSTLVPSIILAQTLAVDHFKLFQEKTLISSTAQKYADSSMQIALAYVLSQTAGLYVKQLNNLFEKIEKKFGKRQSLLSNFLFKGSLYFAPVFIFTEFGKGQIKEFANNYPKGLSFLYSAVETIKNNDFIKSNFSVLGVEKNIQTLYFSTSEGLKVTAYKALEIAMKNPLIPTIAAVSFSIKLFIKNPKEGSLNYKGAIAFFNDFIYNYGAILAGQCFSKIMYEIFRDTYSINIGNNIEWGKFLENFCHPVLANVSLFTGIGVFAASYKYFDNKSSGENKYNDVLKAAGLSLIMVCMSQLSLTAFTVYGGHTFLMSAVIKGSLSYGLQEILLNPECLLSPKDLNTLLPKIMSGVIKHYIHASFSSISFIPFVLSECFMDKAVSFLFPKVFADCEYDDIVSAKGDDLGDRGNSSVDLQL